MRTRFTPPRTTSGERQQQQVEDIQTRPTRLKQEWLWFLLDIRERLLNGENFDPGEIIISLAQLKNHQYLLDLRTKWDMSDRESESESESDSVSSGA